ncbi:hypothetical protein ACIRU3_44555 [Streptomyces sp. NPDC101151]|uniref:hypothetical protein n=1 Tax=Streptomyces sp. NPDC101151 TaxID=3366115 RepID=UPI003824E458
MDMASQILPLAGVAVGAATSFLVTSLNERTKWRREQLVRWDAQRLTAYAEYAHAVKDLAYQYRRIAVARGLTAGPHPLEPTPEVLDRLGDAEVHRTALSETLLLLGDRGTIGAVKRMNQYLWQLERLARATPAQGDSSRWDQNYENYRTARQEYIDHARRSLGVTGPARISPRPS